jgi:hypothetical protein
LRKSLNVKDVKYFIRHFMNVLPVHLIVDSN